MLRLTDLYDDFDSFDESSESDKSEEIIKKKRTYPIQTLS